MCVLVCAHVHVCDDSGSSFSALRSHTYSSLSLLIVVLSQTHAVGSSCMLDTLDSRVNRLCEEGNLLYFISISCSSVWLPSDGLPISEALV